MEIECSSWGQRSNKATYAVLDRMNLSSLPKYILGVVDEIVTKTEEQLVGRQEEV